jgi:hypothetical protein
MGATRAAAVREAAEEASLELDPSDLAPFSFWVPPLGGAKRFATWFFLIEVPHDGSAVVVDQLEIHRSEWMTPATAIARVNAAEMDMAPPTFATLWWLRDQTDTQGATAAARAREPERFSTHIRTHGGVIAASRAVWSRSLTHKVARSFQHTDRPRQHCGDGAPFGQPEIPSSATDSPWLFPGLSAGRPARACWLAIAACATSFDSGHLSLGVAPGARVCARSPDGPTWRPGRAHCIAGRCLPGRTRSSRAGRLSDPIRRRQRRRRDCSSGVPLVRCGSTRATRTPGPGDASNLGARLRRIGVRTLPGRRSAMNHLAARLPAAFLADLLGLHHNTAVRWVRGTGADWSTYAAELVKAPIANLTE